MTLLYDISSLVDALKTDPFRSNLCNSHHLLYQLYHQNWI